MGLLLNNMMELRDKYGMNIHNALAREFVELLNKDNENMHNIKPTDIEKGKFYFFFYGLSEKFTKMEKFSPVYVVDTKRTGNTYTIYAISTNFLPVAVRAKYFDTILAGFKKSDIEDNNVIYSSINYQLAYNTLASLGFEYTIREFDITKLNKVKEIHNNYIDKFLLFNTQIFTDVDENKLTEIWLAKLKTRDERHRKIIIELMNDYNEMAKTILNSINETNQNINKSYIEIQKIINRI